MWALAEPAYSNNSSSHSGSSIGSNACWSPPREQMGDTEVPPPTSFSRYSDTNLSPPSWGVASASPLSSPGKGSGSDQQQQMAAVGGLKAPAHPGVISSGSQSSLGSVPRRSGVPSPDVAFGRLSPTPGLTESTSGWGVLPRANGSDEPSPIQSTGSLQTTTRPLVTRMNSHSGAMMAAASPSGTTVSASSLEGATSSFGRGNLTSPNSGASSPHWTTDPQSHGPHMNRPLMAIVTDYDGLRRGSAPVTTLRRSLQQLSPTAVSSLGSTGSLEAPPVLRAHSASVSPTYPATTVESQSSLPPFGARGRLPAAMVGVNSHHRHTPTASYLPPAPHQQAALHGSNPPYEPQAVPSSSYYHPQQQKQSQPQFMGVSPGSYYGEVSSGYSRHPQQHRVHPQYQKQPQQQYMGHGHYSPQRMFSPDPSIMKLLDARGISKSVRKQLLRKYCGLLKSAPTMDEVLRLYKHWELTSRREVVAYNVTIARARDFSRLDVLSSVFSAMEARAVRPTVVTLSTMLDAFAKAQDERGVNFVISTMRKYAVPPNVFVHNILMRYYLKQNNTYAALDLLNNMRAGTPESQPDLVTYSTLLRGLSNAGQIGKAREVLGLMQQAGIVPVSRVWTSLLLQVLKRACMTPSDVEWSISIFCEILEGMRMALGGPVAPEASVVSAFLDCLFELNGCSPLLIVRTLRAFSGCGVSLTSASLHAVGALFKQRGEEAVFLNIIQELSPPNGVLFPSRRLAEEVVMFLQA